MKGQTKVKKSPGGARLLLASNVKRLMDERFADSTNKPRALADEASLSLSSVQRVLAGDVGASIDTIEALASVFGLTIPELLGAGKDTSAYARLIEDYTALPEAWKYFISRKASDLREIGDTLPSFLKEGLRAIPDESTYWRWESELNAYIRQQKGVVENDGYIGPERRHQDRPHAEERRSNRNAGWERGMRTSTEYTIQESTKPYGVKKKRGSTNK